MLAVQIAGYKKSGKTTLAAALAGVLEQGGRRVSILKFSHHGFDFSGSDTASLSAPGRVVAGISERQSAVFWNEKRWFADMMPLLHADVLLVEGGKSLGLTPRIVCLDALEDLAALKPGLAIASFGRTPHESLGSLPHFYPEDLGDAQKLSALAELAVSSGFLLPGLNCAACGRESCEALALEIAQKRAAPEACRAVGDDEISVAINGQPVALNPFTAKIVAGSINGMLRELKGFSPGDVEIRMKTRKI